MSERSEKYRRFAQECWQMAVKSEDGPNREILRFMAQVWLRIAQENEGCGIPAEAETASEC